MERSGKRVKGSGTCLLWRGVAASVAVQLGRELGEVYSTEATAEMFEQPVQVNVEEEVENTQSAWSDSGSGYGGSTW